MRAASTALAEKPPVAAAAARIVSIDVFRGITMAVMIFVNALSGVRGLPWWTYHAHAEQDLMTYVDMVFPFFLFMVGISMPLSVAQRLKRNPSQAALWLHVATRAFSLLVLGLILANAEYADSARMGMSGSVWALLGLISCSLYLAVYPRWERFPAYSTALRVAGLAGVAVTFAVFRRTTTAGHAAWINFSYPEILGLIGFSYLAAAILYIPTRRLKWAAPAWFALLAALCVASTARILPLLDRLSLYVWPFGNGAMACLVMAGVVTAQIFFGLDPISDERPAAKQAIRAAILFSAVALLAGCITMPLGISKIRATPSWTLWCAGAAVLMFTLLYWICDLRGRTSWAFLFKPAGSNTLTTYLLPDLCDYLLAALSITWLDTHMTHGWPGVLKTVAYTVLMLVFSLGLTRARVRLQL